MRYLNLPDGTLMRAHSPMDDMPFFSDWKRALLARRAAFVTSSSEIDPKTGMPIRQIVTYDRNQEQAHVLAENGDTALIICLGCARPSHLWDLNRIRVGSLVQHSEEEPCNERNGSQIVSLIRKWKVRAVGRLGLGCPRCFACYTDEGNRISRENLDKQGYFELLKAVYIGRGDMAAASKVAPPKLHTPFIDILDGSIQLWEPPAGQMEGAPCA